MVPLIVLLLKLFVNFDLLPISSHILVSDLIKTLQKEAKERIEKQNFKVGSIINKGQKEIIFQPGDWVRIHFRKERFPSQRKKKLHQRGDDPYQVLKKINNNVYKIDFLGEFSVHFTFNVANLSHFDVGDDFSDSRTNPFEEEEDDKDPGIPNVPTGPITRSKAMKIQQTFIVHLQNWIDSFNHHFMCYKLIRLRKDH